MCYYIKPESNSFVIKIVLNFWFFIYYLNVSDGFFILALVGIIKNINQWVIYLFISLFLFYHLYLHRIQITCVQTFSIINISF